MNGKPLLNGPTALSEEQMQMRVVWQYFMEGRTQGEIAQAFSTNRLRINKIIAEARRSGLVTITLNSRLVSCVELERQLVADFRCATPVSCRRPTILIWCRCWWDRRPPIIS